MACSEQEAKGCQEAVAKSETNHEQERERESTEEYLSQEGILPTPQQ